MLSKFEIQRAAHVHFKAKDSQANLASIWKATGYSNSYFFFKFAIHAMYLAPVRTKRRKIFLYVDRMDICTCDKS